MGTQALVKKGIEFLKNGNLSEAKIALVDAIAIEPNNFDALLNLALTYAHSGLLQDAKQLFLKASLVNPQNPEPQYNLGIIYSLEKNSLAAVEAYKNAIHINSTHIEAYTNLSELLIQLERNEEALEAANQAAQLSSSYAETWINQGKALANLKRNEEALGAFKKALELKPTHAEGMLLLAETLDELGQEQESLNQYDRLINQFPQHCGALSNKGIIYHRLKRYEEALEIYAQALRVEPNNAAILTNQGATLNELKRYKEALDAHERSIGINPLIPVSWLNLGVVLQNLKRFDKALAADEQALKILPNYAEALINKGSVLTELKRYEEALNTFTHLLKITPNEKGILAQIMHLKMRLCEWSNYEEYYLNLLEACTKGEDTCQPFISFSLFEESALQKSLAEAWSRKNTSSDSTLPKFSGGKRTGRIRIGYYSPDFKNHPVSYLIAELIELHDRNRFEVIGFSFGSDDLNLMQDRLRNSFDQFIDVKNRSDIEIASLSREMGIDIAIDLCGHTHESRSGIFSHRAAPIQLSYLGHPGTMGSRYIDYIIADPILIPTSNAAHYTEKLIHLPHSFQINDRKRAIATHKLSKKDFGLPESGTVYCCFNNNFKITPNVFRSWMKILAAVDNSVLWLLKDTPAVVENLSKECVKVGVDPARIIFAERIPAELYLARYRLADLFLDTCPFNGGATASDALWAGLPIITKLGDAYAGRMASSLLQAIGLPELVTSTEKEYIELAQALGRDPSRLASIKAKLAHNKLSAPLFNTPLNVKYIETAFEKTMERYLNNQIPDHITITA